MMDTYFPDKDYCQLCRRQTALPGHEHCVACRNLMGAIELRPALALKVAVRSYAHQWLEDARDELGRFWWVTMLACALVLGVAIGLVILMWRTGVLTP
jgi:hypothetical protein